MSRKRSRSWPTPLPVSAQVYAPRALVTGDPRDATLGIAHYLCVPQDHVLRGMADGIAAIRREFAAHVQALRARGDAASATRARDDELCLRYVLDQEAGSLPVLFPHEYLMMDCDEHGNLLPERRSAATGRGMELAEFAAHASARGSRLTEAHVAALRLYTSHAYQSINEPMRDVARFRAGRPHPLPVTVALIDDAAKKLKHASSGTATAWQPRPLYRGMRDIALPADFRAHGGTELAPMSATFSLDTAVRFATGGQRATVMRIHNVDWTTRGADLRFLSCYPSEEESLFAPLTFLRYRPPADGAAPPTVTTQSGVVFDVVDVETQQIASA